MLFFLFRAIFSSFTPAAPDTYPVPDLRGMTVEQARDQADIVNGTFQILEAGSEASDTDVGLIVRQDPDPKTEKKGELPITIQVWVSAGEDVGTMLDLTTGMTYGQAVSSLRDLIEEYELVIQPEHEARQEFDEEADDGIILSTDPVAGEALHKGDTITFVISKGPPTVPLINCEKQERSWAEDQLKNVLGLDVVVHEEASDTVQEGYIIRQNPAATTEVPAGSTVELWVSTGPETPSTGGEDSQVIMIPLPEDKETVKIEAFQDNMEIMNQTVDCARWAYTYPLTVYGSGTVYVEILVDGKVSPASQEVTFGGL